MRDTHERFFWPCSHTVRKYDRRSRQKRKNFPFTKRALTDKERDSATREHWEFHHATWSPEILGHHSTHCDHQTTDLTMIMAPTTAENMFEYFDQISVCHDNLRNKTSMKMLSTYTYFSLFIRFFYLDRIWEPAIELQNY